MSTIQLQSLEELKAKENLPEVPELVQRYLDMEERNSEGKHFRIEVKEKSNPVSGHGIAYLNALIIEERSNGQWAESYNSGMRQYRGAYASDIDNWDLSLNAPAILEESEDEVVYALRTGTGNVKVFRYNGSGGPEQIQRFNVRNHKDTKERIELLKNVISDDSSFRSYVQKSLGHRWHITDRETLDDGNVVVLLSDHADRDYDAISDYYRIYVWVKGQGFGSTSKFHTGLRHPSGRFYRVGIGFKVDLVEKTDDSVSLDIEVKNRSQGWNTRHQIEANW